MHGKYNRSESQEQTVDVHRSRFYVFTATGATQWEYPAPPPNHQAPPTDQSFHTSPSQGADVPAQDGDRGLGKTALAVGGGLLAASALKPFGQKFGAKMAGFFGNKPQQQYYSQSPTPQTQVHVYPVYVPGAPGAPQPYHGQPQGMAPNPGYYPAGDAGGMTAPSGVPPPMPVNANGPSSFPAQNIPPLYIYGAVFADHDVTQAVRSLITPQQTVTLSGETLVKQFGDPWPEAERKMFNVLYAYGDRPMELIAVELVDPVDET